MSSLTQSTMEPTEIAVIGGGPVGLAALIRCRMHDTTVRLFESLPMVGGQVSALYPEKYIYDIFGIPKIKATDLIDNLQKQVGDFPVDLRLNETVEEINVGAENNNFSITTGNGIYQAGSIIVTAGIGEMTPRELRTKGMEQVKSGVLYHIASKMDVAGKRVVILGGGDSAVDWTLELKSVAKQVTIVHHRDEFRAHPENVKKMMHEYRKNNLNVFTPYSAFEVHSVDNEVVGIDIKSVSGKMISIPCDVVLVMFGYVSNLGPIGNWKLELDKKKIVVDQRMQSSITGVFAAGDVVDYPGKIKLIATGFAEAAIAVKSALEYLHPEETIKISYSSKAGVGV